MNLARVSPVTLNGSVQSPILRPATVHQNSVCHIWAEVGVLSMDEIPNPIQKKKVSESLHCLSLFRVLEVLPRWNLV